MTSKERIDISVPDAVLAENASKRRRLEATMAFEPTDRAPVLASAHQGARLHGSGVRFSQLRGGAREHLRGAILGQKWRIERVRDDMPVETAWLKVEPDVGALRGVEFPAQIEWNGDEPPRTRPLIDSPEEIDRLSVPDPAGGLNGWLIQLYRGMQQMADEFDVRLNGERLPVQVETHHLGGPFPSAFALCGANLFLWMKSDPARVHRLMDITTTSHLQVLDYFAAMTGAPRDASVWLGNDGAELMNAKMFREFVAPHLARIWTRHAFPRVLHMCGKVNHLVEILRDELQVTFLDGFGFPLSQQIIGEKLAGQMLLRGGPHPVLIEEGPVEKIIAVCAGYIQTAGIRGGYILSEGFGLAAQTPPAHIEAMVEASKRVGNIADLSRVNRELVARLNPDCIFALAHRQ